MWMICGVIITKQKEDNLNQMKIFNLLLKAIPVLAICLSQKSIAQEQDTASYIKMREVTVIGYKAMNGIGHFNDVNDHVIYAGKKTEVIEIDSIDANKAVNNTRQILGRIPGVNIVESETGGFVANGIGIRGLNPVQSLEMNIRQNGYNVAADVYGYNETYFLPPMEAVARVEIIKGAAATQFGPQFGGMVNYVIKDGSKKSAVDYSMMQTGGSNGLFNSYHAIGGSTGKLNYFGYINVRNLDGWRQNSFQRQLTGYGKIAYKLNDRVSLALEYSMLRNKIKMPGGQTDEQFEADVKSSVRSRNWLKTPWNVATASFNYNINSQTDLQVKTTLLYGKRQLVWVNKLPDVLDVPDQQTGIFPNREVDVEKMNSFVTEARLTHKYELGSIKNIAATGFRFAHAKFTRQEEAVGTNGNDFNFTTLGEYEENSFFTTLNIAVFAENVINLSEKFSITPGIRFESLGSEAEGEVEVGGVEKETETEKERGFLIGGLGLQFKASKAATVYSNFSQSYRPIDYAQMVPLGLVSRVDSNLKDPKGWNVDIGMRGNINQIFNYDFSFFYLSYNNRIGVVQRLDENGTPYTIRSNTDKSIHKGFESYLELNLTKAMGVNKKLGNLNIYQSFGYTDAHYTKGLYKNNQVEYAPKVITRAGIIYSKGFLSTSLQIAYQSKAFGDAANTERSSNPIIGKIPSYTIMDWSITASVKKMKYKAGINNLTNTSYFTQRTDEYPGPGIIPSATRSFYVGVGYNL